MRILAVLGVLSLLAACGDSEPTQEPEVAAEVAAEAALDGAIDGVTDEAISDAAETGTAAMEEAGALVESLVAKMPTIDKTDPDWKTKVTEPEMMTFEPGKSYVWELETSHGTMTFDLFHEQSPMHVNSTVYLTEIGFYDDVVFHRVIPGFMAQGGDPTGSGRGGPAYRYNGEFAPGLSHTRPGMLSMANAGPGTDGSQFFITFEATPFLDGKHTLFGELASGMDVLQSFQAKGSRSGATSEVLKIVKAQILVQ